VKVLKVLRVDWYQQDVEVDVATSGKAVSSPSYKLRINYPPNTFINRPPFAGVWRMLLNVSRQVNGIVALNPNNG
jgi:hypothetical protein